MARRLIRTHTFIHRVTERSLSEWALQWARLGEVAGAIAIGTAAVTSILTTIIILTAITLTISTEARAIDPVKAAAETGNIIPHIAVARPMAIAELPANTADERGNNLPEPEIVRAVAREILQGQIVPEVEPVAEIWRAIGLRAVAATDLAAERAREILAVLIDPVAALEHRLGPAVAPEYRAGLLAEAVQIVSAIEACHLADLAATVHLVVVAEARPDRPVQSARFVARSRR